MENKILLYGLKPMIDRMIDKKLSNEDITKRINKYLAEKDIEDSISSMLISRYKRNLMRDVKFVELNYKQETFEEFWEDIDILINSMTSQNKLAILRKIRRLAREYQSSLFDNEDDDEISEKEKVTNWILDITSGFCPECRKYISNELIKDTNN
jgi:hypothetical protein